MIQSIIKEVIVEKEKFIARGVCERNMTFIDDNNERQELYCLEINLTLSNLHVKLGMPQDGKQFGLSTVMEQALSASKDGQQVVAAINGDFYNMTNGTPIGLTVKEGVLLNVGRKSAVGFKKDGSIVIGEPTLNEEGQLIGEWSEVVNAVGGWQYLIKEGVKQTFESNAFCNSPAPRTVVGVKANGSLLFVVIDGRQRGFSKGVTIHELVDLMYELGVIDALNLDGGGSTTFITRDLGYDTLSVKNRPCDGEERVVANSLLVISTHEKGNVSQLTVLPKQELILPSTILQFKAIPLDEAYHPVDVESELLWYLSDPLMGTIDAHGLFRSSGKEGIVTISACYQNTFLGETNLEIRQPETIAFEKRSLQVNRGSQTELKVKATYRNRPMTTKNTDFTYTVSGSIGTIDQEGLFTASESIGDGAIMVSFGEHKSTLKVTVGQAPIVLEDFEHGIDDWVSSYNKANETRLELVTEPVRFGDYALKLSYDFTNQSGTSGAYAASQRGIQVPGYPQKIGMWVYGDNSHYMLRSILVDGNNNNIYLTFENDIHWTGWKYVEALIPEGLQEPLMLHVHQTIRVLALANQDKIASSIYIDQLRAVYGDTTDDLVNPTVVSVYPKEDSVVKTRVVDIKAEAVDDEGEYATGVHFERTKIFVDGIDYSDRLINIKSKDLIQLLECELCDGSHHVRLFVYDHFGNMTKKEWYFTVDTGEFQFRLDHPKEAYIGNDLNVGLSINNVNHLRSATFTFVYDSILFELKKATIPKKLEQELIIDENKGEFTITFNKFHRGVTNILECLFSIPTTLNRRDVFKLETKEAYVITEDGCKYYLSFKPIELPVKAHLMIDVAKWVVGFDATLNVRNEQNQAVEGVMVEYSTPFVTECVEKLGLTNSEGSLTVKDLTRAPMELLRLQANKENYYSFETRTSIVAHVEQAIANKILLAPTAHPYSEQLITWLTDPKTEGSRVRYGIKGTSQSVSVTGESYMRVFPDGALRVHKVKLTGLEQGATYQYRVGNEDHWSELYEFTMPVRGSGFEFIVFGDSQALPNQGDQNGFGILRSLYDQALSEVPQPDFILHVGDLVDNGGLYHHWSHALTAISGKKSSYRDRWIVAPGNHEYLEIEEFMFYRDLFHPIPNGPKESLAYSFDYQNVHFAILDAIVEKEELQRQLEWLKTDMKQSTAAFKVVVLHKPPYFLNLEGGNGVVAEIVPPVMDELGIDFVFSGHDHNYLRTKPLFNRSVHDHGTIYILAGSTGPKFYKAFEDPSISEVCIEKEQVYLMIHVTSNTFTLRVKNIKGEIVDYYQKVMLV